MDQPPSLVRGFSATVAVRRGARAEGAPDIEETRGLESLRRRTNQLLQAAAGVWQSGQPQHAGGTLGSRIPCPEGVWTMFPSSEERTRTPQGEGAGLARTARTPLSPTVRPHTSVPHGGLHARRLVWLSRPFLCTISKAGGPPNPRRSGCQTA